MKYWTLSEIKDKVRTDLDLYEETFITDSELIGYINDGIDEAESEIHTLYEDYFLSRSTVTLVPNQEAYAFPADIYANKLRRVVYRNGSTYYAIPRIPDWHKFEEYTSGLINSPNQIAGYLPINSTPGTPQILFTPKPNESGALITLWYLRNANRLVADADICDIPEFVTFVLAYAKMKCYEKEGNPNLENSRGTVEQLRVEMNAALSAMVPDANNEIEADYSHYREHS